VRATGGVALAAALTGCSPFGDAVELGPSGDVVARATGPAAGLGVGDEQALVAFVARTGAAGGERIWIARLARGGGLPTAAPLATGELRGRPTTPLVLAGPGDLFSLAWRQRS
jgi:hypothetical protein